MSQPIIIETDNHIFRLWTPDGHRTRYTANYVRKPGAANADGSPVPQGDYIETPVLTEAIALFDPFPGIALTFELAANIAADRQAGAA